MKEKGKQVIIWRDRQGEWSLARGDDPHAEPHIAETPDGFSVGREKPEGSACRFEKDGRPFLLVNVSGGGIRHKPYLLAGRECVPLECLPLDKARLDVCPAAEYAFRSLVKGAGKDDAVTARVFKGSIIVTMMAPDGMRPVARIGVPIPKGSIYADPDVEPWVPAD